MHTTIKSIKSDIIFNLTNCKESIVWERVNRNGFNGTVYTGINQWTLWAKAWNKGYQDVCWITFLQAKELGGTIRKGEKGVKVCKLIPKEGTNDDEFTMRWFTVFNIEQVEGIDRSRLIGPTPDGVKKEKELLAKAQRAIQVMLIGTDSPGHEVSSEQMVNDIISVIEREPQKLDQLIKALR